MPKILPCISPPLPQTEKAKDQWIKCRLLKTDSEKYVKRYQEPVIRNDPQRLKAGAPLRYAESLFVALTVVKSMTGLSYRRLPGMLMMTLGDWDALCYPPLQGAPDPRR